MEAQMLFPSRYLPFNGPRAVLLAFAIGGWLSAVPAFAQAPELPRVFMDTTPVTPSGSTISVPAGGDLQGALNAAQPGDTITLQAGATFSGNFTLPNKTGTGWIVVRSSAPDSSLPLPGTQITPAYASVMPKIVSPNADGALKTPPGVPVHHFRFIGVEFAAASSVTLNYGIVLLGDGNTSGPQTSLGTVPHDLILDRCYIHGNSNLSVSRGVALNSASTAIIDSYISEIHGLGFDTQALGGWNGPGPFKIVNNYLEAAGENVLFGGAVPGIPNLIPSDIEILNNHFFKPLSWKSDEPSYAGTHWSVKNLLELKIAQRLLIDGNLFENSWADAQVGFAIVLTPRKESCNAAWAVVQDVTFTNNIVRHTGSGMNLMGIDDSCPSAGPALHRVLIQNNLFDDVSNTRWNGEGKLFQILRNTTDVVIDHNTGFQSGGIIVGDGEPSTGFVYRNNITPHQAYGVLGTGTGVGNGTLAYYFPSVVFAKNAIAGPWPTAGGATVSMFSNYPANFFPASLQDVGFVDLAGRNYSLASSSPYKNAASDGKDIGVDFGALNAAQSVVQQVNQ
jgi:hypothetical protein